MITLSNLRSITGKSDNLIVKYVEPLNTCFEKYSINTYLRKCHFLAQVLHESGCFRYVKEIASGEAYEGRKDLGNIHSGDGIKYKGRGLIQITGYSNYQSISIDTGIDYLNNPQWLERTSDAVMSAGWYWNKKELNKWADKDDITTITKKINGGLNGYEDRKEWLEKCIIELI